MSKNGLACGLCRAHTRFYLFCWVMPPYDHTVLDLVFPRSSIFSLLGFGIGLSSGGGIEQMLNH